MIAQPDLVQAFTVAFTTDNVEDFYKLIAPEAEWVIMATGETFRGLDQIKDLAVRSVAARDHPVGMGIKPFNIFTNAEGTRLCWEYVHTAVVTGSVAVVSRPACCGDEDQRSHHLELRDSRRQDRQG